MTILENAAKRLALRAIEYVEPITNPNMNCDIEIRRLAIQTLKALGAPVPKSSKAARKMLEAMR